MITVNDISYRVLVGNTSPTTVIVKEPAVQVSSVSLVGPPGANGELALTRRYVLPGSGLSGGGNLSSNITLAVDSTVVRTTGNQVISGQKTFTDNVSISNSILGVDSVRFDLINGRSNEVGQLGWNIEDNTIDISLTNNVTLQIGQEELFLVKNQTGTDILDGTVVMSAGTLGSSGRILVRPAIANGTFNSKTMLGVATEHIANGGEGFITGFGKVRGIDTSMWSEGDILYVSPSVPGTLSNTQPVAPNNKVAIAIVINKSVNNGTIFVRPTFGSSINEDENVHIENIKNGDTLVWSNTTNRFENKSFSSPVFTGNVAINQSTANYSLGVFGTIGFSPGPSVTPVSNGDITFELTNNTTLTIKVKGLDGVVRSAAITLT